MTDTAIQTRNAPGVTAPSRGAPPPANMANELRSAVAELNTRFDERLRRSDQTLNDIRAELAPHAAAIAEMQAALTRMGRPGVPGGEAVPDRVGNQALAEWLRSGNSEPLQRMGAWRPDMAIRASAGSSLSGPHGGYVVLPEVDRVIDRVAAAYSPLAEHARVVTIGGTEYIRHIRSAGPAATWIRREGEEIGEADGLGFNEIRIVAHELQAIPVYPRNLLDDAYFDLQGELAAALAEAFGTETNSAYWNGDGNAQPHGILNYPTAEQTGKAQPDFGKIGFVKTGSTSGWSAAAGDEINVFVQAISRLKPPYLANARFFMDRMTLSQVMLFKDDVGRPIWQPSLQAGVPSTLLGYPVAVVEELSAGASGSFPVAFGDMRAAYTIVRRAGLEILPNPYRKTGAVRFETYGRWGGGLVNSEALKLIKWAT
jgi:HK97 family phage major capsid protein